jgi:predicted nucleic acid-binding protein
MPFVIDASIALAWCFEDQSTPFTVSVLNELRCDSGVVPAIWPLEIANSLVSGERRGRLTRDQVDGAIRLLEALSITVDNRSIAQARTVVLDIARTQRLSTYDACYLDLAIRTQLPLATLDNRLEEAARRVGVELVEPDEFERLARSSQASIDTAKASLRSTAGRTARGTSVTTIPVEAFKTELLSLFDETFEAVSGHYLDRGTSLFETLETVDAAQASRPLSDSCGTIAAQVNHVAFYLDVINRYFLGENPGRVDWDASWDVGAVSDADWTALTAALRDAHARTRALLVAQTDFSTDTDRIGEAMAFVVHTAHHLGEIRQALCAIRGSAS